MFYFVRDFFFNYLLQSLISSILKRDRPLDPAESTVTTAENKASVIKKPLRMCKQLFTLQD